MYVIRYAFGIYLSFFLFLCSAFFSTASLAADGGYWSTTERRMIPQSEVNSRVQGMLDSAVKKPTGSTLGTAPTASSVPAVTKNATGGLSATSQNIINNMGHPSTFDSTINNSAASAKNALKTCIRSPACAGRALGAGAVIYEGINAWKDVYDILFDDETQQATVPDYDSRTEINAPSYPNPSATASARVESWNNQTSCPSYNDRGERVMWCVVQGNGISLASCGENWRPPYNLVGISTNHASCQYAPDEPWQEEVPRVPISEQALDDALETYEPSVSDSPIVLLSGEPESITLSTPASVELPSTTTTNTSSGGQTTTSVTNNTITYNVTNNNTTSPSINSSTVSNTTVYDGTGNVTDTSTSTTISNGVQPAPAPAPSPPLELDFELPSFCSWASIVCDWIGWTKEPLGYDEPDLSVLISEFEPEEGVFDLGIGSGECPAPIQLNITFIGKTVEVSYQPFCDFVLMIRPFILAAAYLFAAYLYLGVLKRG